MNLKKSEEKEPNEKKNEDSSQRKKLTKKEAMDELLGDYDSLTTEEEKQKIAENIEKTTKYLKDIGIEEMHIDEKKNIIIVPFEYEELQFLSQFIIGVEWIVAKASIMELEKIPEEMYSKVFFELLKGNFVLNKVTYSVDPEGKSIWCEADIPADFNFDYFKLEYLSMVFAIDFFIKSISKELSDFKNIPLESTYKKDEKDKQMYI